MSKPPNPSPPIIEKDLTGKTVGRFEIDKRLGSGGMGEVYRARDAKLHRIVALKRVAAHVYANEKSRERLWKEALCASRLNDPHIAAIYDAIEEQHEVFLVMEYVEGQTLRERMRTPLPFHEFLAIARQCLAGLNAAHRGGIQHRDIKPENILLTGDGRVKILDFGIARRLPGDVQGTTLDSLTSDGFFGTIIYMAPEVVEERPSDNRADIFSLGVVFYEALTGSHPFHAATFFETCNRIVKQTPPPVSEANGETPKALDNIIARMLAKRPADRYANAGDALADLEELPQGEGSGLTRLPAPSIKANSFSYWKAVLIAVTCAIAAVAGSFTYQKLRKPVLSEHASILITDFDNHTGQAVLDQTVSEAVRESLEQSHYFRVIPRSQIEETAQRMGKPTLVHVDRSLGRELCLRDNCNAVLDGSIVATGAKYEITDELINPVKDTPVLVETASMNSPADLYSAVDTLSKKLRNGLGESMAQIASNSQPLADVTTSSLEALQRYSKALNLYASGDLQGFLPLAEDAVALDSNFAMAHLYLARAYESLGNETKSRQHLAAAVAGVNHVTERERYVILAENYGDQESYEKAVDEFRLLTEAYPDDIEGFRGLAEMSESVGGPQNAIAAEERVVALAPYSAIGHLRLILYLDRANRFDEALKDYATARANGVGSSLLHWGAGLAYLGEGNASMARTEFQLLGTEGGDNGESIASFYLARVLMYEGRLHAAADELRKGIILDEKAQSEAYIPVRHYLLADIAATQGNFEMARAESAQVAEAAFRSPQSDLLRRAGEILIRARGLAAAESIMRRLAKLREQHKSGFLQSCYFNLKGDLELAQNHADASAESQKKASVFFPLENAYLGLGDALAAKHDWIGAANAYQQYLGFKGEIFHTGSPSKWVLAHLSMARALAKAGERADALHYYDQFLQLWAHADPELAALREARAEKVRLSGVKQTDSSGRTERL